MSNTTGYYQDQSTVALTASFVRFPLGIYPSLLTLVNDDNSGSNKLAFSYDGTNTHGVLLAQDSYTIDTANQGAIWLKYVTGAPAYRLIVKAA
jgi:hypothetical protein